MGGTPAPAFHSDSPQAVDEIAGPAIVGLPGACLKPWHHHAIVECFPVFNFCTLPSSKSLAVSTRQVDFIYFLVMGMLQSFYFVLSHPNTPAASGGQFEPRSVISISICRNTS
jgi:hypothetical protein